jgi:hypothetical protein
MHRVKLSYYPRASTIAAIKDLAQMDDRVFTSLA